MSNIPFLNRVLCRHDWARAEEWAAAIESLADLSDADIAGLESANENRMRRNLAPVGRED